MVASTTDSDVAAPLGQRPGSADDGSVMVTSALEPAADGVQRAPRVVIVDDQVAFRSAARSVVGMLRGWQVVGEADSGEHGVEQVAAVHPDVVLMDINLPGINGIEATRRILANEPSVAVVLLSTYAADDLPDDARSCGAAGYVRKDDLTPALLRSLLER
jgi:two-component system invasion response regulator UvrY